MKDISPSLIEIITFNSHPTPYGPFRLTNFNAKIIKIEKCPSTFTSILYILNNFHHFPHQIEIIVIEIEDENGEVNIDKEIIEKLSEKFKNHTLIISFEQQGVEKSPKILYKSFDEEVFKLTEIHELKLEESHKENFQCENFEKLLRILRSKICGKFSSSLLDVEVDLRKDFNEELKKFRRIKKSKIKETGNLTEFKKSKKFNFFLPKNKKFEKNPLDLKDPDDVEIQPTSSEQDITLLDLAISSNNFLTLKFLQLFNIDLFLKNSQGDRPLEQAVKTSKNSSFKSLIGVENLTTLSNLRDIKCHDALKLLRDQSGFNLLMIACRSNNQEILNFFLKFKIFDVNYKANENLTALDVAIVGGNHEIALKLLLNDAKYSSNLDEIKSKEISGFLKDMKRIHDLVGKIDEIIEEGDFKEQGDDSKRGNLNNQEGKEKRDQEGPGNQKGSKRKLIKDPENQGEDSDIKVTPQKPQKPSKVQKFLTILSKYPTLTHFFNSSSNSLPATAIKSNNSQLYEFLLSKGITLSSHEDINDLLTSNDSDDDEKIQRKYRDLHRKFIKSPIESHLTKIFSKIQIGLDVKGDDRRNFFILIVDAIKKLNLIPEVENLFEIIAESDELNLVFEFNRNSVDQLDPTSDKTTLGMTYLNGWIYLGVKGLLENFKNLALGTIAHEVCHYAMQLVFSNTCKPFGNQDEELRREFEGIIEEYQGTTDEDIIWRVFKCYRRNLWAAELIVRVPELLAFYQDNPAKMREIKVRFSKLFDFYQKIWNKFLKNAPKLIAGKQQVKFINSIVGIESELVALSREIEFKIPMDVKNLQKPQIFISNSPKLTLLSIHQNKSLDSKIFVNFEAMKISEKLKMIRKAHELSIKPLLIVICNENDENFESLNKKFTKRVIFIINDQNNLKSSQKITHKWEDFTPVTQKVLANSDVSFQGKIINFHRLIPDITSKVFNFLPLNALINDKILKFGNELNYSKKFYYSRSLLREVEKEDVKQLVTCTKEEEKHSHHSGHQHLHHGHYHEIHQHPGENSQHPGENSQHPRENSQHPGEIHQHPEKFASKSLITEHHHNDHQKNTNNDIDEGWEVWEEHLHPVEKVKPHVHHHHHHSKETEIVNLKFKDLLLEEVILLSDKPGMGKSTTFRHFAMKLKKKFNNFWILYIDLKLYFEIYQDFNEINHWNHEKITKIIAKMFNFTEFESEVFKALLSSRKVIFLIDGVDEISPNFKNFIFNLTLGIKNQANCQIWIATRPHCVDLFQQEFQTIPCRLEPIDGAKFLNELLQAKKIPESEVKKIEKFIDELSVAIWKNIDYNNPMLIKIVTKIHKELEIDDNLYSIYHKFVQKIFATLINKGMLRQLNLVKSTTYAVPIVMSMHQRIALKSIEERSKSENLKEKLKSLKIHKIHSDLTIYQLFGFGILYGQSIERCFFIHQTFSDFFVAKFTVDEILMDLSARESEIETKLEFLWILLTEKGNRNVLRFIDCYLKNNGDKIPTDSKNLIKTFLRPKTEGLSTTLLSSFKSLFIKQKFQTLPQNSTPKFLKETIFYLFECRYESIIKFLFQLFKGDREVLKILFSINKIDDCSIFCEISDEFAKSLWCLWEVSVDLLNSGPEKAFLKNFLCCSRHIHPPIDVAIIQLRVEDLTKFFYSLPKVYEEEEIFTLLSIKSYSEYTIFERTVLRMVCSVEFFESMNIFEPFWGYARGYFEKGGCRFELFVKVVKELSFNYHKVPFDKEKWFERFIFVLEEANGEFLTPATIKPLFTYKTKYNETVLHHISSCLKSNVVEGILEEVQKYLNQTEQKNLLTKDFQHRNPFLKICSVQNLVNLEILWDFIKKLLTFEEQKSFLLEQDINQWNALHYILMLSRSQKKEQIELVISLYEDFFDENQMRKFLRSRNVFDETILFECFQNYGDLHDAVCFYYKKMFEDEKIKEFLSFKNSSGKTAFCVKKSFEENEKILENMKFVNEFVAKNFSEGEREDLLMGEGQ